ncbi:hypothetical protein SAMN02745116_02098 [Pilibacter termitis]|uniref:Uncharacterized protein n=2 Tax=Pilibacter termitis TaxID=263852 RepID=A0A1T4Q8H0_9ENTE|nr:hypothetical protein SAMN02745116_02098 [Pilibacter termitis]
MDEIGKLRMLSLISGIVYIAVILSMFVRLLFLFEQTSDKTIINATMIPFGIILLILTIALIVIKTICKRKIKAAKIHASLKF